MLIFKAGFAEGWRGIPDASKRVRRRDGENSASTIERAGVQRVGEIEPQQRRVVARDSDPKSHAHVALHSAPTNVAIDGLSAVGEKRDARPEELENLAAQKDALLGIDDESTTPLERKVGIGAEAVLSIGEELHVAI